MVEERPGEVKVHCDGFDSEYDEWIGTDSPRLRWVGKISDAEVAAWDAKDGVGGANMEWKVIQHRMPGHFINWLKLRKCGMVFLTPDT